jgi:hypothetical protein
VAQSPQYIAPGALGLPRDTLREQVEQGVEEARWRLGPLRVEPVLRLHDVAYTDNAFGSVEEEAVADWTATAGAGAKAYLPLGDAVLALHALPEYVWWQDLDELREWRGRYGAGLFGYFNRVTVELQGTLAERQDYLTSELGVRAGFEQRRGAVDLAVDLAGPIAVFAGAARSEFEHEAAPAGPGAPDPAALDREEETLRGGLRYTRRGFTLGLGAERVATDFQGAAGDRSNEGSGPLVELGFEGGKVDLALTAARRSLTARQDGAFAEFEEVAGDARLGLRPGGRLGWALYGARSLVYSALAADEVFLETRWGASVDADLGWRTTASVFAERGTYDFRAAPGGVDPGRDESVAVGGQLRFEVRKNLAFTLGAVRTDYDSDLPERDRTITTLRTGLAFGAGSASTW